MECYIVRVYRRNEPEPQNIIGLVETVGTGGTKPFRNAGELLDILAGRDAKKTGTKGGGKRSGKTGEKRI
jgi:hypothetical protein